MALSTATSDGFIVNPATVLTAHTVSKLPATHASIVSGICQSNCLTFADILLTSFHALSAETMTHRRKQT
jgi:hypothetical protein